MNTVFFPYPNFTQTSDKNSSLVLDVPELTKWGQDVASAGLSVNHAITQLVNEVADIKEFITFATTQDPELIRKFQEYNEIKEKVSGGEHV